MSILKLQREDNTVKKTFIIVLVMVMTVSLALVGCGSKGVPADSRYIGTWEATGAEFKGEAVDLNEALNNDVFIVTLDADGTCKVVSGADVSTGSWSETGSGVKLKGDDLNMTLKDKDGSLALTILGFTITLDKK